jgi:hypothetical protein
MQEAIKSLEILLDPYDWFHEICMEGNRYIVYVSYMDKSQDTIIPDRATDGRQILCHFVHSMAPKEQLLNLPFPTTVPAQIESSTVVSMLHLQEELDRLGIICGSHTLLDVFYETHDQKNAITNMSARYPQVRAAMEKLYHQYGFSAIYEVLDV